MSKVNNKNGFTLIELMVVIVILGIISAIMIPRLVGVIERARITADQATVRTLNSVTAFFRITNSSADPFKDENKTDKELIEVLVDGGYLLSVLEPQTKGATFAWLIDDKRWYLIFEDSFYVVSLEDGLSMQENRDGWLVGSYIGSSRDIVIPISLNGEIIKEIGNKSFEGVGLVAVVFSSNSHVTAIQSQAFRNNQLTEIILPYSLTTIGNHAFRENPGLKKIVVGSNVDIGDAAFGFNRDDNTFRDVYESNEKSAGTYIFEDGEWVKK